MAKHVWMGLWVVALAVGCPADDSDETAGGTTGGSGSATDPTGTETDDGTDTAGNADFEPVLLDCPQPASLPFTTQTNALQTLEAMMLVADNPRVKDQASDLLGVPGGVVAHTAVENDTVPSPALSVFTGIKARTTPDEGVVANGIAGEWVSLWGYDTMGWTELARAQTTATGLYSFEGVAPGPNRLQPHYAILEGDGSCSPHYNFLLPSGTQVVVADIDGTLTLDDQQLLDQISDGSYVPLENGSASTMMNAWADKGYITVYLTARPHAFRTESRVWLRDLGYPVGPVISANSLVFGDTARQYKAAWVNRIKNDFAWDVVAAYGNATSDIDAYADAGIPKEVTFIIGEDAGADGTQAVADNDYASHIADYVMAQPDATPIP